MCGRFALTATPDEVRRWFGYPETPNFPARYNIAPTQPIAIVRTEGGGRHFALVRWGLVPSWVKDPNEFSLLINARSETAAEKPSFRNAMKNGRCLVPASGFYEWRRPDSGPKQAYWIRPRDGGLVAFAGLWESWADRDGGDVETGAILTTNASPTIAAIHHRMPAVIAPEDFDAWLDTATVPARKAVEMLKPAPDDLFEAIPVSNRVNAVRNDDPDLLSEIEIEEGSEPAPAPKRAAAGGKKASAKKSPPDDGQMSLL
ncbi:MAG: DUF159 family protein [Hyphomicrobiales bacterium]|nr:MAG: DUF159 family protein [Hyphomicrobiales bacterium]